MKFKPKFHPVALVWSLLFSVPLASANGCRSITDIAAHLDLVRTGHTYPPYILHPDLMQLRSEYFALSKQYSSVSAVALQAKAARLVAARKRIGVVATLIRAVDASIPEKVLLWDLHRKELQEYLPGWGTAQINLTDGQIFFLGVADRSYKTHVLLFQKDGSMWRGNVPLELAREIRNRSVSYIDPKSVGLWEIKPDHPFVTPVNSGS